MVFHSDAAPVGRLRVGVLLCEGERLALFDVGVEKSENVSGGLQPLVPLHLRPVRAGFGQRVEKTAKEGMKCGGEAWR